MLGIACGVVVEGTTDQTDNVLVPAAVYVATVLVDRAALHLASLNE